MAITHRGLFAIFASAITLAAGPEHELTEARAPAAAPWIILVEGSVQGRRAVFGDWDVNNRLMHALALNAAVDARDLATRRGFRVVLFWGAQWHNWREMRIDPETLSFDRANQHARFYPATQTQRSVWAFEAAPLLPAPSSLRAIDSTGIAILAARGVMVRER